jgi:hypothetical protein
VDGPNGMSDCGCVGRSGMAVGKMILDKGRVELMRLIRWWPRLTGLQQTVQGFSGFSKQTSQSKCPLEHLKMGKEGRTGTTAQTAQRSVKLLVLGIGGVLLILCHLQTSYE